MIINTYDTMIVRETYMNAFEIDVDNDNVTDFRLSSFNLNAPWWHAGFANGTSINCLHNSATLLSNLKKDTLFFNIVRDTVRDDFKVIIFLNYTKSCSRIGSDDTINKIWEQHKILSRKSNQIISNGESFFSDSITLTRAAFSDFGVLIYHNNDTAIYQKEVYFDKCNTLNNDEILYFGIKIGERLGWLKLMILDDYKLLLFESALQK